MWILPRNLPSLNSALATEDFISDLNEQSDAFAQSLLVKSKVTASRTWLRKWSRDSWTRHLAGRMLKPSQLYNFEAWWTSFVRDTLASRSPLLDLGRAPRIPATSGPTSTGQSVKCNLELSSSRTSRATSRLDSPQSSVIWKKQVTEQRGDYSARLKSARLTSASASSSLESSWATPRAAGSAGSNDVEWSPGKKPTKNGLPITTTLNDQVRIAENWTTPQVQDSKHGDSPANRNRDLLCAEVHRNWSTPRASDGEKGGPNQRDSSGSQPLPSQVLNWPTPHSNCSTGPGSTGRAGGLNIQTAVEQANWPTPTAPGAHCVGTIEEWGGSKNPTRTAGQPDQDSPNSPGKPHGRLNPDWVDQLMGLPIGWTDCDWTATASSQLPSNELSESLAAA